MRLNPFDPGRIQVRGGGGGGFPGGGGGKLGCGTIVILLIGVFVFGADPMQMLGSLDSVQQGAPVENTGPQDEQALCTQNRYANEACNALDNLNQTWEPLFRQAGIAFRQPTLVFYRGGTASGCGSASATMGPFYCPADESIYIDTTFYDQLDRELGAGGDFARYYVIAHEYGHHVQKLTGVADRIAGFQRSNPPQANQAQVVMELQADCYAGAWAGKNRNAIEPGDFEEGMTAASAIGDDTLMRRAGQAVNQESFTHGSSAQRMQALRLGLDSGDDSKCDRIVDEG